MIAKTQMAVLGIDVSSSRVLRTASSFQDIPISPFVATLSLFAVCPAVADVASRCYPQHYRLYPLILKLNVTVYSHPVWYLGKDTG